MLDTMFDNEALLRERESVLLGEAGYSDDLLMASAYDDARCRELVHADIRATLTTTWLRTLSDFLR